MYITWTCFRNVFFKLSAKWQHTETNTNLPFSMSTSFDIYDTVADLLFPLQK